MNMDARRLIAQAKRDVALGIKDKSDPKLIISERDRKDTSGNRKSGKNIQY